VWYVDNSKGRVTHRWGPFAHGAVPAGAKAREAEAEEERQVIDAIGGDAALHKIIDSIGQLPATCSADLPRAASLARASPRQKHSKITS
jgi:hypothetical protein